MKKSLAKLPSPVLVGVVKEKTVEAAKAEISNCIYDGAGMIDLHLSCLENTDTETLRNIIGFSKAPILALNYNVNLQWKDAGYAEDARVESFRRAIDAGAAGIDMQGYTFHLPSKTGFCGEDKFSFTKGNPKEIVTDEAVISRQCEFIEEVHAKGAEVLLSCHPGVVMDSRQVVDLALFLEKRNPDIIKIVTVATTEEDLLESMKAMLALKKEVKTPVTYHANGQAGMLSRIMNPVMGGHLVFCVDRYKTGSTLEQPDLRTAKEVIDGLLKIKID